MAGWVSAPQAHSRVSNINFDIWFSFMKGVLYEYHMKNILRTAKFLTTWGLSQRYCPGLSLTEVSGWVFAPQAHSRVSNINFDIWNFLGEPYKYPMKNSLRTAKFFLAWGLDQRYCLGLKWIDVKVLQRNAMLWDIPYTKNSNVIPGISVFTGHTWRPS